MKLKKALLLTVLIAMFATMVSSVFAIVPGDYDLFGPRAQRVRFNFYAGPAPEFTALENHDIDMTDWSISADEVSKWSVPAYDYIDIVSYGGEAGIFCLDVNENETMPDGSHNPLGDRTLVPLTIDTPGLPLTGWSGNLRRGYALKLAIYCLVDRPNFVTTVLQGLGEAVFTWMPGFYGAYQLGSAESMGAGYSVQKHPYSQAAAIEILDETGFVDTDADTLRNDPVTGANLDLKFYIRFQHTPGRKELGDILVTELTNVDIGYTRFDVDGTGAFANVMVAKDFHLYTGGWNLGTTPDHLYALFHNDYYWDSGMFCLNYGHHDDPLHNLWSEQIYYAPDLATAATANWECQTIDEDPASLGPISVWSYASPKAYHKTVVGGLHVGDDWTGIVNEPGFGVNSYYTFLYMHPDTVGRYDQFGTDVTDGIIEYGIYVSAIPGALNPFYASWYTDYEVIQQCYDGLTVYDPLDPTNLAAYKPWLATSWEVTTWDDAGTDKTKVTFWLRKDIEWHDGTPFTAADVNFTVSYAYTSGDVDWYSAIADLHHWEIPDDYTIVFYEDVLSVWALNWLSGFPVVPKHIWEPIVAANTTYGFSPDPSLIGTGPYQVYPNSIDPAALDYYVPDAFLLLDKNHNFFRGVGTANVDLRTPASVDIYIYSDPDLGEVDVTVTVDGGTPYTITRVNVAGGWGYTTIPGLAQGVHDIQVTVPPDGTWSGLIYVPSETAMPGDLAGSRLSPPRDPPDMKLDFRDLFWFLKAYNQRV
jgi:ABC-type transport system substrate-binding protein